MSGGKFDWQKALDCAEHVTDIESPAIFDLGILEVARLYPNCEKLRD